MFNLIQASGRMLLERFTISLKPEPSNELSNKLGKDSGMERSLYC
nr:hypothetical protein [Trichocoleus desertorum]